MATPRQYEAAGLRRVANEHCEASAMDLGATVLGWRPHGFDEVLFLSREAAVGPGLETHGGIPICAPWFSSGRDEVAVAAQHGLVRWVPWRLVSHLDDADGTRLIWELTQAAVSHLPGAADYPADLRYRHEVLFGRRLELRFTVNSPTTEFILDEAFHAYFSTPAADTTITGLEGVPFRDHTEEPPRWTFSDTPLVPNRHVDRVYRSAADLRLVTPRHTLDISTENADSVVVWNPGPDVPDDFGADEWTRMVCVEVGNVQADAVTVPAGGSHTMTIVASVRSVTGA